MVNSIPLTYLYFMRSYFSYSMIFSGVWFCSRCDSEHFILAINFTQQHLRPINCPNHHFSPHLKVGNEVSWCFPYNCPPTTHRSNGQPTEMRTVSTRQTWTTLSHQKERQQSKNVKDKSKSFILIKDRPIEVSKVIQGLKFIRLDSMSP